jgi:hypothetical protein
MNQEALLGGRADRDARLAGHRLTVSADGTGDERAPLRLGEPTLHRGHRRPRRLSERLVRPLRRLLQRVGHPLRLRRDQRRRISDLPAQRPGPPLQLFGAVRVTLLTEGRRDLPRPDLAILEASRDVTERLVQYSPEKIFFRVGVAEKHPSALRDSSPQVSGLRVVGGPGAGRAARLMASSWPPGTA